MMHRAVPFLTTLVLVTGCGAATSVPDSSFPEPQAARAERLRLDAPEMARVADRLRELAVAASQDEEPARARELIQLSDLTLLSGFELLARADSAEQRLVRAAETAAAECPPGERERSRRVASSEHGRRERRSAASRRAVTRQAEEDDPEPSTQETRVREHLAALAGRLSEVVPTQSNRVTLESVQTALIEADRALAAGELARAVGYAQEAERLLATLRAAPVAAPDGGEDDDSQQSSG